MTNQAAVRMRARTAPSTEVPSIDLPDGSKAELRDGALDVRDPAGRLLIRYRDGNAEIAAPHGDLRLIAPAGRVVIESALDVEIGAGRDLVQRAGRAVEIDAPGARLRMDANAVGLRGDQLEVEARGARATFGEATLVARALTSTIERVAIAAVEYERIAERVVERAKDSFREVAGLAEERAGRVRTLVRGAFSLTTETTDLRSTEETNIDGKRIHLG